MWWWNQVRQKRYISLATLTLSKPGIFPGVPSCFSIYAWVWLKWIPLACYVKAGGFGGMPPLHSMECYSCIYSYFWIYLFSLREAVYYGIEIQIQWVVQFHLNVSFCIKITLLIETVAQPCFKHSGLISSGPCSMLPISNLTQHQ